MLFFDGHTQIKCSKLIDFIFFIWSSSIREVFFMSLRRSWLSSNPIIVKVVLMRKRKSMMKLGFFGIKSGREKEVTKLYSKLKLRWSTREKEKILENKTNCRKENLWKHFSCDWFSIIFRQQFNVIAGKSSEFEVIFAFRFLQKSAEPTVVAHFNDRYQITDVNFQFVWISWEIIVNNLTSVQKKKWKD